MMRQAVRAQGPADSEERPRLSPQAAFVVQLAADSSIDAGEVAGRIEHMATGTSEPFATLEELLRFMKRLGFIGGKATC
jgi:hypothetical protein